MKICKITSGDIYEWAYHRWNDATIVCNDHNRCELNSCIHRLSFSLYSENKFTDASKHNGRCKNSSDTPENNSLVKEWVMPWVYLNPIWAKYCEWHSVHAVLVPPIHVEQSKTTSFAVFIQTNDLMSTGHYSQSNGPPTVDVRSPLLRLLPLKRQVF